MSLKIADLLLQSYLPAGNELTGECFYLFFLKY